jgi:hypothetical protein
MSKLSLIDAIFLWVETSQVPAHVAGLQIYKLPENKVWLRNRGLVVGCLPRCRRPRMLSKTISQKSLRETEREQ